MRSPARAVASRTVSPLTKLAIKSLVNTAKNIDNIHLNVFLHTVTLLWTACMAKLMVQEQPGNTRIALTTSWVI